MGVTHVPFYPSDWLAGTRGLSAVETGIYITLIAMMYERGGAIADDRERLARLCGASKAQFTAALQTLIDDGKILIEGEFLSNEKVKKVLENVKGKSKTAKEKAEARWTKNTNEINATTMHMHQVSSRSAYAGDMLAKAKAKEEASLLEKTTDSGDPKTEPRPSDRTLFDEVEAACRKALGEHAPTDLVIGPMVEIVRTGAKLTRIVAILETEASKPRRSPIRTWRLWARIVAERLNEPEQPDRPDKDLDGYDPFWFRKSYPDDVWRQIMTEFVRDGTWHEASSGYRPGHDLCAVPAHILAEFRPKQAISG